jgi:hypothetical protein
VTLWRPVADSGYRASFAAPAGDAVVTLAEEAGMINAVDPAIDPGRPAASIDLRHPPHLNSAFARTKYRRRQRAARLISRPQGVTAGDTADCNFNLTAPPWQWS